MSPRADADPHLHLVRSPTTLADGEVYHYVYLRYEIWDEEKGRHQPKPLASLGREDQVDEERVESLGSFLKEWVRKDSSLPKEALRERFQELESAFKILCSKDFGLRWLIEQAWEELGYAEAVAELAEATEHDFRVDLAIFCMVCAQLISPRSKRAAAAWVSSEIFFPEADDLEVHHLYRAMDVLGAGYETVEKKLSETLRALGVETSQVAHDTTTVSFAIHHDDKERAALEERRVEKGEAIRSATVNVPPIRMRGKSKDRRPDLPQIKVEGLLGQDHGLVVHHVTHPGQTSDQKLTPESVEALRELGYQDITWAGDTGTNSASNRQALREAGFEYVLGEGVARTKAVREVLSRPGRYRPHPDKPHLGYKVVINRAHEEAEKGEEGPERLYVIRRNEKKRADKLRLLEERVEACRSVIEEGDEEKREKLLRDGTLKQYVRRDARRKDEDGEPAGPAILDREAIRLARLRAGKTVIGTDDLEANPLEADGDYRGLYDLERTFRTLKSTIELGPVRHRRSDRIQAHVMIGIMAFNLGRWLEEKSGLSIERLKNLFANLRVQEVLMNEARFWEVVELEEEQIEVIERMGYDLPPKRFTWSVAPRPDIKR